MFAMRYHLEYPRFTNPRIQNIVLPWYMGPAVELNMLPSIMFGSTLFLGHGNNFEPRKWYRAPSAQTL